MFDVWRNVLAELEQVVSHESFATWFSGAKMIENSEGKVKIGVSNIFKERQLKSKYDQQIREALKNNGVEVETVDYVVVNDSKVTRRPREITFTEVQPETKVKKKAPKETPPLVRRLETGLNPAYSMENFVIGTNNNVAVSVAKNIIENPGGRFNPFFLYGGPGLGKTHLVQAIGNELVRKNPDLKVRYTSTTDFFSDFIQSLRKKGDKGESQADIFIRTYRSLDVLIVDDFQMIVGKEASQNAFFDVFNDLYQHNKQVIVTSDRLPDQLKTVDRRLSSRLAMTGPIDLQMPSFEDRCAILRMKADYMGQEVEDEVIEFVANNAKSNIRELEGEFNKVLLYAEVKGIRPIEVIHGGYVSTTTSVHKSTVSPQMVVGKVAEEYDLTVEEMCGKSRVSHIKNARQVAMYLLREELGLSTTQTALEVGVKDHTTVMHGEKKIRNDLNTNFELREQIESIKRKLYE